MRDDSIGSRPRAKPNPHRTEQRQDADEGNENPFPSDRDQTRVEGEDGCRGGGVCGIWSRLCCKDRRRLGYGAPMRLWSLGPPRRAVWLSPERATERPWPAFPTAPEPNSLDPCWVQTPPLLVQTHAAPALLLSTNPPITAVLPSAERDAEIPCS